MYEGLHAGCNSMYIAGLTVAEFLFLHVILAYELRSLHDLSLAF